MSNILRKLITQNLLNKNEIIEFSKIKDNPDNKSISKKDLEILHKNELGVDIRDFNIFYNLFIKILSDDKNLFLDKIEKIDNDIIYFKKFNNLKEFDKEKHPYTQTFIRFLIELFYYDKFNIYINLFQKENSLYIRNNNIFILNFKEYQLFTSKLIIENILKTRLLILFYGGFCKASLINSYTFLFNKKYIHFYKKNKLFILKEYIKLALLLKVRSKYILKNIFNFKNLKINNLNFYNFNKLEDFYDLFQQLTEEKILEILNYINNNIDTEFFYKFDNITTNNDYFIFEYKNKELLKTYFNQSNKNLLKVIKENKDFYKKLEKKYKENDLIYLNNFIFYNPLINSKYFIDPILYGVEIFKDLEINFYNNMFKKSSSK